MKIGKRTLRRLWPVGVGVALIVAATVAATAFAGGTGKSTTAKQNVDTKTLIVAVSSDIQNLDPTLSSADVSTQELLTNVYDWLIDYKVVNQGRRPIRLAQRIRRRDRPELLVQQEPHGRHVPPAQGRQVRERRPARRQPRSSTRTTGSSSRPASRRP